MPEVLEKLLTSSKVLVQMIWNSFPDFARRQLQLDRVER